MNDDSNVWRIVDLVFNLRLFVFIFIYAIILLAIFLVIPDDDYYGT